MALHGQQLIGSLSANAKTKAWLFTATEDLEGVIPFIHFKAVYFSMLSPTYCLQRMYSVYRSLTLGRVTVFHIFIVLMLRPSCSIQFRCSSFNFLT